VRTQVSLLAAVTLAAAVSGSLGSSTDRSAPRASAGLCYDAKVMTAFTGTVTVGPVCVPYSGATDCIPAGTGLGSLFSVTADVCLPAPQSTVSTADV